MLLEKFNERCQDFEITGPGIALSALPLKADTEKAPENRQMELFNSLCDTIFNISSLKQNWNSFIPTSQENLHVLRFFGLRTTAKRGTTYACVQVPPP